MCTKKRYNVGSLWKSEGKIKKESDPVMKKTFLFKKLLPLLLALLMLTAAVTGCGAKNNGGTTEGTTTPEPSTPAENPLDDPERAAFADEIGGVSETFKGAVSKEAYNTSVEAAEAFVSIEVAGEKDDIVVVESTSKGTLSEEKINSIGIPEDLMEGATAVEEIEVSYSVSNADTQLASTDGLIPISGTLSTTKKAIVYVIKYDVDWKYFTPAPITGDTISKSYYDSVFNTEKYANCTLQSVSVKTDTSTGSYEGESYTVVTETKTTQTIKYANNKIYFEQKVETTAEDGSTQTQILAAYMEEVDGEISCYIRMGGEDAEWMKSHLSVIGFTKLEELRPFYNQYLDYTYFTKTSYGFALDEENMKRYISEVVGILLDDFNEPGVGLDLDIFAEYYVSEGVLSGMRMETNIDSRISEDGLTVVTNQKIANTITCTNYGTTVVEKPFTE